MIEDLTPNGTPVVYVTLAECPFCHAVGAKVYGGTDQGDGSRLQYARCVAIDCPGNPARDGSKTFRVVIGNYSASFQQR